MKIDELMVGDWYYWESEGKMYPYQVTAEDFVKGEIPNFQPVSLTMSILINSGFKEDEETRKIINSKSTDVHFLVCGLISLTNDDSQINSFNKWYLHIDNEDRNTICTAEITYVHELQHLLKQCKIEKEIIL